MSNVPHSLLVASVVMNAYWAFLVLISNTTQNAASKIIITMPMVLTVMTVVAIAFKSAA